MFVACTAPCQLMADLAGLLSPPPLAVQASFCLTWNDALNWLTAALQHQQECSTQCTAPSNTNH
jgi:hypothetical protein